MTASERSLLECAKSLPASTTSALLSTLASSLLAQEGFATRELALPASTTPTAPTTAIRAKSSGALVTLAL